MTNSENGCPFTSLWTLKLLWHLKYTESKSAFCNKLIVDGFEVKKDQNNKKDHKVDG